METNNKTVADGMKEIYFAGGCFWGTERLFKSIKGVTFTECGYANGKKSIVPDYKKVCTGETGYRETVHVIYDPLKVKLTQLLKAFFYIIDPTLEKRQGDDIGDQYQTGIYYKDEETGSAVSEYAENEKQKYPVFAVEISPLTVFFTAEEYHQDYLEKNPDGYCHIPFWQIENINDVIKES